MADDESIVIKPREFSVDLLLPENNSELAKFMDEPLTAIAETITGAMAAGPKTWMMMGGRIVQSMFKAKLFQQVSEEIKGLRDVGAIPKDYADESKYRYGAKTWVELMSIIDNEAPDADHLDALKAMFYGVNKISASDGERIVNYQLFQIAKKLTSAQVLYLRASYELFKAKDFTAGQSEDSRKWLRKVGVKLGHQVIGLLDKDDLALIEHGLLTARYAPDKSGILQNDAHLSDLGLKFCEVIQEYQLIREQIDLRQEFTP